LEVPAALVRCQQSRRYLFSAASHLYAQKVFTQHFLTAKARIACLNYVEKAQKEQRLNFRKGIKN
jgi:hypothetical protein